MRGPTSSVCGKMGFNCKNTRAKAALDNDSTLEKLSMLSPLYQKTRLLARQTMRISYTRHQMKKSFQKKERARKL